MAAKRTTADQTQHLRGEGTAVLIGTPRTLPMLLDQLALLPEAPLPIAYVALADEPGAALEAPSAPALTAFSLGLTGNAQEVHTARDLEGLVAELTPSLAVVSLPRNHPGLSALRARLHALGIPERFVPPLTELLEQDPAVAGTSGGGSRLGELGISTSRSVATGAMISAATGALSLDFAELIGRTPYGIDRRAVARLLERRRVLITGAGGSIGSEIARIVATFRPAELVLMERAENALFEIDRQMARRYPEVPRRAVLHDVVDADATQRIVAELRPDVIFHAAAHKHVPLMEDHPAHAVSNNLFGTKAIADAAVAAGVERFVMISSDKAVNPTSVMGATKRLAEMYIQALHRQCRASRAAGRPSSFSMVRFGNVLGSACSVLPIWETQIADGGPITVTDPRMTRYFMTIHEAAALVIQSAAIDPSAGVAGDSANIYVLDMGEPVRILDLAQRFARARGFEPSVSIARSARPEVAFPEVAGTTRAAERGGSRSPSMEIVLTGARPGEKIHEELAYAAEQLRPTPFPGIMAWAGFLGDQFNLEAMVQELGAVRRSPDREAVVRTIRRHVPEMITPVAQGTDQDSDRVRTLNRAA